MKKKLVLLLATLMCISLCACGGSETSSGNNTDMQKEESGGLFKTEQEIQITIDNWQEYFEFIEVIRVDEVYNAFDEPVSDYPYDYCLTIKDNYEIDIEKSNIAIELKGHCEEWSVNLDKDTLAIEYIEKIKDFHTIDKIVEFEQLFKNYEELDREIYYGVQLTPQGDSYTIQFDEETQSSTMYRYFIDEVVRIQGTICIKEK